MLSQSRKQNNITIYVCVCFTIRQPIFWELGEILGCRQKENNDFTVSDRKSLRAKPKVVVEEEGGVEGIRLGVGCRQGIAWTNVTKFGQGTMHKKRCFSCLNKRFTSVSYSLKTTTNLSPLQPAHHFIMIEGGKGLGNGGGVYVESAFSSNILLCSIYNQFRTVVTSILQFLLCDVV